MQVCCDYCDRPAELVDGSVIYPHRPDLRSKWFYRCKPCSAYVGCHPKTKWPLGRLANAELRRMKSIAHTQFDKLWKEKHFRSRSAAYAWLAGELGLKREDCHIGMFNEEQCKAVVNAVYNYNRRKG